MKAVAYYRLSKKRASGVYLGLDAQREIVKTYAQANGLTVVQEFTEIETGTGKRQRPEIQKAIQAAIADGAKLVIAALDRLARNVHFVANLLESGVDFVAVDLPQANKFTIHILAAVAEQEATLIAKRTRNALKEARARGTKLGKPENLTIEAQAKGREVQKDRANHRKKRLAGYIKLMKDNGMSFRQIHRRLQQEGMKQENGKPISYAFVQRTYDYAKQEVHSLPK